MTKKDLINVAVIGASGYTGAETVRLISRHPAAKLVCLVADSNAGKPVGSLYPHLADQGLPDLITIDKVEWDKIDVAFFCMPHGMSQGMLASVPEHVRIVDLAADFRIFSLESYKEWYEHEHAAPELQKSAVYGLTEIYRDKIRDARLVACPGCYPTSILLPLIPLLREKQISPEHIIIDSKSGISGAGRSAKVANLFTEVNEGMRAYGIGGHRHLAEIEQELSLANGSGVRVTFTPQVAPMTRGIMSVIYVDMEKGQSIVDLRETLQKQYKNEPFVHVRSSNPTPSTKETLGSNLAVINLFKDRVGNRAIIVSTIDNLIKGASGQALQNMNLMFGLSETEGLPHIPLFP